MVCSPHRPLVELVAFPSYLQSSYANTPYTEMKVYSELFSYVTQDRYAASRTSDSTAYQATPTFQYEPGSYRYTPVPGLAPAGAFTSRPETIDSVVNTGLPPQFRSPIITYARKNRQEDYSMNKRNEMKEIDNKRQELAQKVLAELQKVRPKEAQPHMHADGITHTHTNDHV